MEDGAWYDAREVDAPLSDYGVAQLTDTGSDNGCVVYDSDGH